MPLHRFRLSLADARIPGLALLFLSTLAIAGELNPPAGPVAPTMRTLTEVFDAANSGGGGPGGGGDEAFSNPLPCATWPVVADAAPTAMIEGLPGLTPPGAITLVSFNYSIARPASGGGSGAATVGDITILKQIDRTSPALHQACITGAHASNMLVTLRRAGGSQYFQYSFNDLVVREVRPTLMTTCSGNFAHFELVTLAFASVTISSLDGGETATINNPTPPTE